MTESLNHLQAFIKELVNEAVHSALEQHQENVQLDSMGIAIKSEVLNADQAAELLHIAKQTLYSLTSRRKIPFYKNGKKILFKRGDLEEWMNAGKQEQLSKVHQEARNYVRQNPIKK
jgi:excisionase family DNA binding protein